MDFLPFLDVDVDVDVVAWDVVVLNDPPPRSAALAMRAPLLLGHHP
jgi:hypothetical protein